MSASVTDISPARALSTVAWSVTVTPSAMTISSPAGDIPTTCNLWPPCSINAGTWNTWAKTPSAPTVATPSKVGVEYIHTSTFDPGNIPAPSTRVVEPGTYTSDPFGNRGWRSPDGEIAAIIRVESPTSAFI